MLGFLDFVKTLPHEAITLVIGAAGGIAGFLVGDEKGWRMVLAAAFVGSFAGYVFPPAIIAIIETSGASIADDVRVSITGGISAASWQLTITLKTVLPAIAEKFGKSKIGK